MERNEGGDVRGKIYRESFKYGLRVHVSNRKGGKIMESIKERIRDVDFEKYERYKKLCLCYQEEGGAGSLQERELFSIAEISGNMQFSNLYLEIRRNPYGGCACWLWNDLGCVAIRVCYIYPCYTLEYNLLLALENPVAKLK